VKKHIKSEYIFEVSKSHRSANYLYDALALIPCFVSRLHWRLNL